MKTQRPSLTALSILTAATLLAACSSSPDDTAADSSVDVDPAPQSTTSDSTDSEGTDSTETADTVEATTEGSKALSPLGNPTTEDKQQSPGVGTDLVPVGVRVADHDSFTRVVLDFEGTGTAGWFTQLGPEPTQQASGFPIEYEGETAINIGVESTPWPSTPELEEAYMDFGTVPGAGVVTGVEFVTTFEAQSQYVIGLEKESPYSVTFLNDQPRVVIDILH